MLKQTNQQTNLGWNQLLFILIQIIIFVFFILNIFKTMKKKLFYEFLSENIQLKQDTKLNKFIKHLYSGLKKELNLQKPYNKFSLSLQRSFFYKIL